MRRSTWVLCILAVMVIGVSVDAAPAQQHQWEIPEQGGEEMFRQADRAFSVGSDSGGAGIDIGPTQELRPRPGGQPISNSRCAMDSQNCTGVCVNYMNYWCVPDDCGGFDFC